MANDPRVSVIVAVRNGQSTIGRCIDSLLALDHPDVEIIAVDDGSGDDTRRILESYGSRIRLIVNESCRGPSASRNRGAETATGSFVAFTDGDCVADRQWLKELGKGFTGPDVAGSGGAQDIPADETPFGAAVSVFLRRAGAVSDYARGDRGGIVSVAHNPSCNSIYRRDIFLREGGFLPGLWPGEDVELDHRLTLKGYRLSFNSSARVSHYRAGTPKSFARMMFRYGRAQGALVRRYGFFRKTQFLIFLVPAVLLVGAALGVLNLPVAWIAGVAALAVFVMLGLKTAVLSLIAIPCWTVGFLTGAVSLSMPD